MWSGEIFLRNFLPYPPPNIPGLKGGGYVKLPEGKWVVGGLLAIFHCYRQPGDPGKPGVRSSRS